MFSQPMKLRHGFNQSQKLRVVDRKGIRTLKTCSKGCPAHQRLKEKREGLVMPKIEWHGQLVYWKKFQPVHA